jgi:hypothetical protein
MMSSRSNRTDLRVTSLSFPDNSEITSGSVFTNNVNFKKRLRVEGETNCAGNMSLSKNLTVTGSSTFKGDTNIEGDFTVQGAIPYVDNQTGWGLSEWTISGSTYNKNLDSLIMKIKAVQTSLTNYATVTYVDANTEIRNYISVFSAGTFPVYSGSGFYNRKVIRPNSNSIFLISSDATYPTDFKFQKGSVAQGKYLRCADSDGTVEWATVTNDIPTLSGINTSSGQTSSAAFSVVDSVGGSRGQYFYPNLPSNSGYNTKISAGDIGCLAGPGNASTGSTTFGFIIGTFNGNQAVRFTSDSLVNGVVTRGMTQLSGGSSLSTIQLRSDGIFHSVGGQESFSIVLNAKTGTNTQKGVEITSQSWPQGTATPTLSIVQRNDETPQKARNIWFNPILNVSNYNRIVELYDAAMLFGNVDGTLDTRPTQFHLAAWSSYADAITIRNSIPGEEENSSAIPPVAANSNFSGFVRLSACCGHTSYSILDSGITYSKRVPNTYLIVDRQGIKCKVESTKFIKFFGLTQVHNYTGAVLNDSTTTSRTSKFEVGTSTSNVNFDMNGVLKYYYSSLSTLNVAGYLLSSNDSVGTMVWKTVDEMFPSTISKSVNFTHTIKYSKDASTILTNNSNLYCLGNDGLTGDVKWVKIPVQSNGTVTEKINFTDAISLYNQMFFVTLDAGLVTAAAVGGIAYAIASDNSRVGSQYWSSPDNGLTFYWRYEIPQPTSEVPPFTYSLKIDVNGTNSKLFKVSNSYPPVTDFITPTNPNPNRFQFETSNKTVTDAYIKFWSSNPADISPVDVTEPGNFCLAGNFNYRNYDSSTNTYEIPQKGQILVNWSGTTYTPPGSNSSEESYGVATWKNIESVLTNNFTGDHYFTDDLFVGSDSNYVVNEYGVNVTKEKTRGFLKIFGKMYYRYATSDTGTGSSPVNQYLKCINGSTGEVGWSTVDSTLPASPTFTSVTTTTATVSTALTVNGTTATAISIPLGGITIGSTLSAGGAATFSGGINCSGTRSNINSVILGSTGASPVQVVLTANGYSEINDLLYYKIPGRKLGHVLSCTDESSGRVEWKEPELVELPVNPTFQSILANKITANSIFDTYSTATATPSFPKWLLAAANSASSQPTANVKYTSSINNVVNFVCKAGTSRGYIFRTNLWLRFRWRYSTSRLNTSEAAYIYFRIFKVTARIYRNGNQIELRDIPALKNYPDAGTGIRISHDRYTSTSGPYDSNSSTIHECEVFLYTPEIWFQVIQSTSDADYKIDLTVEWSYQLTGINITANPPLILVKPPNNNAWFEFFNKADQSMSAQDPVYSTLTTWQGDTIYGFKGTTFPAGGDVNTASNSQFTSVHWNVASNGSANTGVRNGYIFGGGDLQYMANFCSESSFLSPRNDHTFMTANANITELTAGSITLAGIGGNGVVNSCGYACRRGLPRTPPNNAPRDDMVQSSLNLSNQGDVINYDNYLGSYNQWGNIFNMWWHTNNRLQFYVDHTYIGAIELSTSDRRIKQNFKHAPRVLDRLCTLPMYQFDFVQHEVINTSENHVGFIADELQTIFPDVPHLISGKKDEVDANGNYLLQQRNDTEIISILIKAIQELREEVQDLKNRLNIN